MGEWFEGQDFAVPGRRIRWCDSSRDRLAILLEPPGGNAMSRAVEKNRRGRFALYAFYFGVRQTETSLVGSLPRISSRAKPLRQWCRALSTSNWMC